MRKVLVGCSGGLDSSVAVLLLLQDGYQVSLLHLITWSYAQQRGGKNTVSYSDNVVASTKILDLSQLINIPFYELDIRELFFDDIVCGFINDYLRCVTPNPCVLCNKNIKFKMLHDKALDSGCEYIATGHYANINNSCGRYFITKAVDSKKDQSYFLWGLPQEYLRRIIFPLGGWKKDDVKCYAHDNGLDGMYIDRESEDICFLSGYHYSTLLRQYKFDELDSLRGGCFVFEGNVVGHHDSYPFYTVGQRRGLNIALGFPVFVQKIDAKTNTVYLCREEDLYADEMIVTNLNFQKYEAIPDGFECDVKIRYNDSGHRCVVSLVDDKTVKVKFIDRARAVTPGQSAVFYEDNDIILGGIIVK